MLRGGCWFASEMSCFYDKHRAVLVDVFRDCKMETYAKQLGFGLWLVPRAHDYVAGHQRLGAIKEYFAKVEDKYGTRATAINGKTRYYRTLQTTDAGCQCKYAYEGTGKAQCAQY